MQRRECTVHYGTQYTYGREAMIDQRAGEESSGLIHINVQVYGDSVDDAYDSHRASYVIAGPGACRARYDGYPSTQHGIFTFYFTFWTIKMLAKREPSQMTNNPLVCFVASRNGVPSQTIQLDL